MIDLIINNQPDDETCGPTCLHALYRYYGLNDSLEDVISGVERSASGGTLAALLGLHARQRQMEAVIYVNNLDVFDPTWFKNGESDSDQLIQKLEEQMQYKKNEGIQQSSLAYQNYLKSGGIVRFKTISVDLLKKYFKLNIPILAGLSATYLYRCARERYTPDGRCHYDDIQGTPCGHFVLLCGYDETRRHIIVADPHRANPFSHNNLYEENPLSHDNYYKVSSRRLINAIMLGVLTYDANLLIIQPQEGRSYAHHSGH